MPGTDVSVLSTCDGPRLQPVVRCGARKQQIKVVVLRNTTGRIVLPRFEHVSESGLRKTPSPGPVSLTATAARPALPMTER